MERGPSSRYAMAYLKVDYFCRILSSSDGRISLMRKMLVFFFSVYLLASIISPCHLSCLDITSPSAGEHQGNSHSNPGHSQDPVNPCKDKVQGPAGHSCCNMVSQSASFYFFPSGFSFFVPNETLFFPTEIPQSIFHPPKPQA